jgi:translocation and assembly module TamA
MESVDVRISGPGDSAALARLVASSPLQPGTRLEHASYDRLRNDLLRTALDIGYLDAKLTRRELLVNPPARTASAHLELETGGQYRFGAIEVEQDVLRDELLERFIRFETGQVFSNQRIRNTQFALEDSNFFSTVSVSPGQRDPETLTVPMKIRAEPVKRDRYTVSLGYARTPTSAAGSPGRIAGQHARTPAALRGHGVLRAAGGHNALHFRVGDPALEARVLRRLHNEAWRPTASATSSSGR